MVLCPLVVVCTMPHSMPYARSMPLSNSIYLYYPFYILGSTAMPLEIASNSMHLCYAFNELDLTLLRK